MTSAQVKKAFARMNLGATDLARLLQTGRSTIYRWEEHGTDGCNAILLGLVLRGKVSVKDIEADETFSRRS